MNIQMSGAEVLGDYACHLKSLDQTDKYTRFGYYPTNENIDSLILYLLYYPDSNFLFTAKEKGKPIGFVQLSRIQNDEWELAVSVDKEHQNKGIAGDLMYCSIAWAKTHNIKHIFMHCIAENRKIQHLARKYGLRIVERDGPDIKALVELPLPTALDYGADWVNEQQSIINEIIRLQNKLIKNIVPKM